MSTNLFKLLLGFSVILLLFYFYNDFTLKENFESTTRNMYGNMRRLKRNIKKRKETFIDNLKYKLKTKLRKAKF
jgi:hypothetical protein